MKYLKTYEGNMDKIQSFVDKLMVNPDWNLLINLLRRNFIKKNDVTPYIKEDNGLLILNLLQDGFFEKKELKELVGDVKIVGDLGDYAKLKLWSDGFITDEKVSKIFGDLHYEDGNLYLLASFFDLESYFDKSMLDLIFGDIGDWWYSGDNYYLMQTADYIWSDLNKENMEEIIKYIIGKEIDYEYYRTPEEYHFWDLEAKSEYFQWSEKDKEYKFIYSGYTYEIDAILDENKKGNLSELYDFLSIALNRAQEQADQEEYYKYAKKAIEKRFTNWKFITVGKNEYMAFLAHDINWDPVMDGLEEQYKDYGIVDFTEEYFGDIWYMFKEFNDEGKDSFPDYGLYGSIDETTLNEIVSEDLEYRKDDLK